MIPLIFMYKISYLLDRQKSLMNGRICKSGQDVQIMLFMKLRSSTKGSLY